MATALDIKTAFPRGAVSKTNIKKERRMHARRYKKTY
jgi:hypothetical protein